MTISSDTPEQWLARHPKHQLGAIMLSDPELVVTDLFGLRNTGIHSGMPGGANALPVPTSLLASPEGKVLWMDQSENYQQRSDPSLVLTALKTPLT